MTTMRDTIVPKSDQLNYDDFVLGPIDVTVKGGHIVGDKEQPLVISLEDGYRDYKPCKSMRRVLLAVWGANGKEWIGRKMRLYGDSSVSYGGKAVGGIRISHMSHITEPQKIMLTVARMRRVEHTVFPLAATKSAAGE